MVQQQQKQLQYGDSVTNEVRVRVMVGEKGSLGCGVCKGLVPGLTVQVPPKISIQISIKKKKRRKLSSEKKKKPSTNFRTREREDRRARPVLRPAT